MTTPRRPATRGECENGPRPCPFVSCRYHLYLDVWRDGRLTVNESVEVLDMPETCALDVADRGGTTHVEIGALLDVTRSRVQQIEHEALVRLSGEAMVRTLHEELQEPLAAGEHALAMAADMADEPGDD